MLAAALAVGCLVSLAAQHGSTAALDRFPLRSGGLQIDRATHAGRYFDVIGRRAALFGYENRAFEAWVYPLEILDGFSLSFRLAGYPLDIDGRDIMSSIQVRPESTTIVYAHAAFTVRQTMFVPIDEPGALVLLDVDSVLPISIAVSFRPRLRLMWPAPSTTPAIAWDPDAHLYTIAEETGRYAGVVGSPDARDISMMPYQEGPRDVPIQFVIDGTPERLAHMRIPIAIAGSAERRQNARAVYDRLLATVPVLYEKTAAHYEDLDRNSLSISTPDDRLNVAFRWAKIGIDKGLATNPLLGTGLLAGFGTAGESERPGYAWFFGRDALWTSLATTSEGAFDTTRAALEFLRKFQRTDGKIPHEISQSAPVVKWFDDYPYAWASADATPLYVIAHADLFQATGDRAFLAQAWPSIVRAYRFSAGTDSDNNGLIENTNVGHGWVEGGALYPPHEEIYLQGLWIEASRGMTTLADAMGDRELAARAAATADRARDSMEATYWNQDRGFYNFATKRLSDSARIAEPGPNRERRQARLDQLRSTRMIDEDTVLPAVPLWFGTARDDRAQQEIDHLGSSAIATDWGARIISNQSALYDPLSYHYGSVWPLFTGWSAVGAYRYGRPHVGYQALMANALLTFTGTPGDVTELLSGDFDTPFGRSSPHQVWSEAMVIAPAVRGLLGLEASDKGRTIQFAPALPMTWNHVEVHNFAVGTARFDLAYTRSDGKIVVDVRRAGASGNTYRIVFAPALPQDARVRTVTVNGTAVRTDIRKLGDVQRVQIGADVDSHVELVCGFDEGTDVFAPIEGASSGSPSHGIRVLRARADANALHLLVEGLGNETYTLVVRTPRRLGTTDGVSISAPGTPDQRLAIAFDGPAGKYTRREITVPLLGR